MSVKEHQRRAAARLRDVLNAPWRDRAACSPQTGYAPPEVKQLPNMTAEGRYEQREAALFCHTYCTVVEACKNFAMDTGEKHYVWGGLTDTERKHLARRERDRKRREST